MSVDVCYAFIFLAEAVTIRMYCCNIFEQRRSIFTSTLVLFALYIFLYIISFFHNSCVNVILFFITAVLYIRSLYYSHTSLALFHGIILTLIMCISELFTSIVFYSRTSDIFQQSFSQANTDFSFLAILACFSKTLYFTNAYILAHAFQWHYRKQPIKFQISMDLLLIPAFTFVVLTTFLHIRRNFNLDENTRIFVGISALFLFLITAFTYHIYDSIQRKNEEVTISQIAIQKESYTASYYKKIKTF